jgi:hypothetical protein
MRRRVALSALLVLMISLCASSAALATAPDKKKAKSPCDLLTPTEIMQVRSLAVDHGTRSGRSCRWDAVAPESANGQTVVYTTLLRPRGSSQSERFADGQDAYEGAQSLEQQLGLATEDVSGLGKAATWEVSKQNLAVLAKSGYIFEVTPEVVSNEVLAPEDVKARAIALAMYALKRV